MRTKRLERLLKLLQSLQSKNWSTVEDLAIAAGVSRRTVFRDLEVLASAGIPFRYDHVTRRYAAEKTSLLPPVSMSHPEAMALLMAAHYMLGRPFVTDLAAARSAAVKLQSVLPLSVIRRGPRVASVESHSGAERATRRRGGVVENNSGSGR